MSKSSVILQIAFSACALILAGAMQSSAVESFEVQANLNGAYLPYALDNLDSTNTMKASKLMQCPIRVAAPYHEGGDSGVYVKAYNPALNVDDPGNFGTRSFPGMQALDEDPVRLIINLYDLYEDAILDRTMIASAGHHKDSAWAIRVCPLGDSIRTARLFLTSGTDSVGNGKWDPGILLLLLEDYDYDGYTEAFFHVNSGREGTPRELFCVEMETMRLEWSLPVASVLSPRGLHSLRDSLHPGVIFVGGNPSQGVADANFRDCYKPLCIVDSSGHILSNQILGITYSHTNLCPNASHDYFFITHEIDGSTTDAFRQQRPPGFYVTKVDRQGRPVCWADTDDEAASLWSAPFDNQPRNSLHVQFRDRTMRVYDNELVLHAQADDGGWLGPFIMSVALPEQDDSALVFAAGVFTRDLKKLAQFPFGAWDCDVMAYDSLGCASVLVVNAENRCAILKLHRKSALELVSVFYHENQEYVLMALSGLLVGMIVTGFSRRRIRGNLQLISAQKEKLEQIHGKLEKTHEALKETQAKLVAAEKFKTAKDIAGGFAHEIRNALFPADGILTSLLKSDLSKKTTPANLKDDLRDTRNAVSNAIGITELISDYTKLDAQHSPESVNLASSLQKVLKNNRHRIENQQVDIRISGDESTEVTSRQQQFAMVLNNLLLNSLDAMEGRDGPRIDVEWKPSNGVVTFSFADNGTGMKPDQCAHAFDVFYTTKPDTGTGIGLSVVKKVIALYGGDVSISSQPENGTTFRLNLKPANGETN